MRTNKPFAFVTILKPFSFVLVALMVLGTMRAGYAAWSIRNSGTWPEDWPKQLEPLRNQSRTYSHMSEEVYEIPFSDREEFESVWPHILAVKGPEAPITLLSSPDDEFPRTVEAGVRIRAPLTGWLLSPEGTRYPPGAKPAVTNHLLRIGPPWPDALKSQSGALPEFVFYGNGAWAPGSSNTNEPRTGREHQLRRARTDLELVVDGKIVDLTRLALPSNAPTIDKRFEPRPTNAASDTNVIAPLGPMFAVVRPQTSVAHPVTLKGEPLPNLSTLGLATADVPAGQPVVVLLIDAEQRSSRRTLKLLTDQAEALKTKHVAAILIQAGSMADAAYAAWLQETGLPFPIARLKDASEKGRSAWGATALPWLILADRNHRVVAEGFPIEELDARLQAAAEGTSQPISAQPSRVTTRPQEPDSPDWTSLQRERYEKMTNDTARGLFRASNGDPDRFVRLSFSHGIPLRATQEVLDRDDLPRLYAILKDPDQSAYWEKAAAIVGMIGTDAKSAKELMDFAKRPIDWAVITNEQRATTHVIAKASVVRWLGRMKDAGADEALLRLLSPDGANELVKHWIDDPSLPRWGRDRAQVLGMVRGSAAIGLVLTGKKEHAARVEEAYQQVATLPVSPANGELYNQLVDAMAIKRLIADEGVDGYEQSLGMPNALNVLRPYLREFDKRRAPGSPAQR